MGTNVLDKKWIWKYNQVRVLLYKRLRGIKVMGTKEIVSLLRKLEDEEVNAIKNIMSILNKEKKQVN